MPTLSTRVSKAPFCKAFLVTQGRHDCDILRHRMCSHSSHSSHSSHRLGTPPIFRNQNVRVIRVIIYISIVFYSDIWQCVKTLYPFCSHQNSWDLWMFIPLKMLWKQVLVHTHIDPYSDIIYIKIFLNFGAKDLQLTPLDLATGRLGKLFLLQGNHQTWSETHVSYQLQADLLGGLSKLMSKLI